MPLYNIMVKKIALILVSVLLALGVSAKVGIRAGLNFAGQSLESDYDLRLSELTGFQIGAVYQYIYMPKKVGVGGESGVLFTQRGCLFSDDGEAVKGYNELNYLEIPLNLRFHAMFGPIGLYAYAGMYGSYLLRAKSILDGESADAKLALGGFAERLDYGYAVGAGIEVLRKFQLGVSWNDGLKNIADAYKHTDLKISSAKNRMLSVNLVLLF